MTGSQLPEKPKLLTSEQLASRAQQGDRRAFECLVDRHGPSLLRFLTLRVGNRHDAEDVLQDTFVRAYTRLHRYQPQRRFNTWLFTIAARLATDHRRRLRPASQTEAATSAQADPLEQLILDERRDRIWQQAQLLPATQFTALYLHYVEDLPPRDIARVMRKSAVHTRVLLHRARTTLAQRLSDAQAVSDVPQARSPESDTILPEGANS